MSHGVGHTQLRSGLAVAVVQVGSCSSGSTLRLGTSICLGCSPKRQKQTNKKKKKINMYFGLPSPVPGQGSYNLCNFLSEKKNSCFFFLCFIFILFIFLAFQLIIKPEEGSWEPPLDPQNLSTPLQGVVTAQAVLAGGRRCLGRGYNEVPAPPASESPLLGPTGTLSPHTHFRASDAPTRRWG